MNKEELQFFKRSLQAEGINNAEVSVHRKPRRSCDVIKLQKELGEEVIGTTKEITDLEYHQVADIEQFLGLVASDMATQIKTYSTEKHTWGENVVLFDLKGDYSVTCRRCGNMADMNDVNPQAMSLAETAVPKPATENYDSLSKTKIKFTLLALLREGCDPSCPNRNL